MPSLGTISLTIILLISSGWGIQKSRDWLRDEQSTQAPRAPLYLPKARYVKLVTLGYDNLAGDILWFNTINYFGREYLGNQDFKWLTEMCELVTTIDNRSLHVYEFCGTLLSWIAKEPRRSNRILTLAIGKHPSHWRFRYLRGFNYWYFLNQKEKAKQDFAVAAKLPDAPPFLASLASRLMVDMESPEVAIEYLKEMLSETNNTSVRAALKDKLKRAVISRDKRKLKQLIVHWEKKHNKPLESLRQLVTAGMLRFIPQDPFGGQYSFNTETRSIDNTSGQKGLEFFGKTAQTGIFREEFSSP